MLPLKQELHEVGRRDRLDFPPESPDRETVNPCEQPTITPFFPGTILPEPAAQRLTVRLKAEERSLHLRSRQMELPGQFFGCRGAGALHPALNDSTDRFIPFLEFLCANSFYRRTVLGGRKDRANRSEAFGGDPAGELPSHYDGRAASLEQCGEEGRPVSSEFLRHPDQRQQGVVQFVRVADHRPGLFCHLGDRCRVQRAEIPGQVRRQAPAHLDGARPPLLERRVIQVRVRVGVQDLVAEGRRHGRVHREAADLAALDAPEHGHEAVHVHRLGQAVADGFPDQRMVG